MPAKRKTHTSPVVEATPETQAKQPDYQGIDLSKPTKEEALELRKNFELSGFHELSDGSWRLYFKNYAANTDRELKPAAGYITSKGETNITYFDHPLEAAQHFNTIRGEWLRENNIQ